MHFTESDYRQSQSGILSIFYYLIIFSLYAITYDTSFSVLGKTLIKTAKLAETKIWRNCRKRKKLYQSRQFWFWCKSLQLLKTPVWLYWIQGRSKLAARLPVDCSSLNSHYNNGIILIKIPIKNIFKNWKSLLNLNENLNNIFKVNGNIRLHKYECNWIV